MPSSIDHRGATFAFTKMHGLGNDYVYVDCFKQSLEGVDVPALAAKISDRHRGIGGPVEKIHHCLFVARKRHQVRW